MGSRTVSNSAVQIARRLIGGTRSERESDVPSARSAADACDHLYRELSRWVGPDGCHALFTRALAEARSDHPALTHIQLRVRADPYVDGTTESIVAHGEPATAGALEDMVAILVELLSRLIGNEMAIKLIDRTLATSNRADPTMDSEREES